MSEIREGYKRTKVGVIPEDWDIPRIDSVLQRIRKKVDVEKETLYQQIGIRSHAKGIFHKEPVTGEVLGNKSVFWIEEDSFIVNIVFAWEQAVAKTTTNEKGMIASHRFPMYKSKDNKADIDYILYFFKSKRGKHLLGLASPGGAGRNKTLGQKEFAELKIPLPPLKEQQKIARILSTWDDAISKQEALIEAKERLKKGLMQRLLSGEVRFDLGAGTLVPSNKELNTNRTEVPAPEWEEVRLKEVVNCFDNKRIPINKQKRHKIQGNIPYYGSTSIVDYINDYIFDEDIVLVSEDGGYFYEFETRPIAFYVTGKSWVNNHVHIIKNKNDSLGLKFLYYSLVHKNITAFLNGGTRAKLNKKDLLLLKIKLPSKKEQQKIAQVLTIADKEIELLKSELTAFKEQKRGLMQRLLTGEVRVRV
ncbi:MAG: restriction endonuclease subunit S [Sulfurovum sp.]|nr:restriction endonuclease subunit S [Sulfurovum sp.]